MTDADLLLPRGLNTLTDAESEHLGLGLINAFGAELIGDTINGWLLELETGHRVWLDGNTVTVADVWAVAKASV